MAAALNKAGTQKKNNNLRAQEWGLMSAKRTFLCAHFDKGAAASSFSFGLEMRRLGKWRARHFTKHVEKTVLVRIYIKNRSRQSSEVF
jgi:hypothetical protein